MLARGAAVLLFYLDLERSGIDDAAMKRHHLLNAEAVGAKTVEKFKKIAELMGFDSARLTEDGVDTVGLFNKSKIKSKFAKFDPSKKDSANLLASGILGSIGLNALMSKKEK